MDKRSIHNAEHVFRQVEQLLDGTKILDYDRTPDKLQIAFEERPESLCSTPNELFMKSVMAMPEAGT